MGAVTEKTLAVPGHGPVGGRRDLIEFRNMLRSVRDAVAALKRQGKSADEAVATWGTFVFGPEAFTRLVYAGA